MRIIEGTPEECRAYAERMRSTQPTGWDRKEMYPEEYRQEATRSPRIEAEPDQDKYYPFGRSCSQEAKKPVCVHCGLPLSAMSRKFFCDEKCTVEFYAGWSNSQDLPIQKGIMPEPCRSSQDGPICAQCGGPLDKPLQTFQRDGILFCCKECADKPQSCQCINRAKLRAILRDYLGPEEIAEVLGRMT